MPTKTKTDEFIGGSVNLGSFFSTGNLWEQSPEAAKGNFEPIPTGTYPVIVDTVAGPEEYTNANGETKARLKVTLRISDGDFRGRLFWDNLWLTDNAQFRLQQFLIACDQEDLDDYVPGMLDGAALRVEVTQRTYERDGQTRYANDVKKYLPPTDEQQTADWGV